MGWEANPRCCPWSWCFHRNTSQTGAEFLGMLHRVLLFSCLLVENWTEKGETLSWAWSRANWQGGGGRGQESTAVSHMTQTLRFMVRDPGTSNFHLWLGAPLGFPQPTHDTQTMSWSLSFLCSTVSELLALCQASSSGIRQEEGARDPAQRTRVWPCRGSIWCH